MYQVIVKVAPKNRSNPTAKYKSATYKGLYVLENESSKMAHEKITKDVESRLRANLESQNPELTFNMRSKVTRLQVEFCFKHQHNESRT